MNVVMMLLSVISLFAITIGLIKHTNEVRWQRYLDQLEKELVEAKKNVQFTFLSGCSNEEWQHAVYRYNEILNIYECARRGITTRGEKIWR